MFEHICLRSNGNSAKLDQMSYSGFEEKVELGLTGPGSELPVCFPTALELLANHHTLKIATYLAYIGYCIADGNILKHKRNELATVAMSMMAQDVGLDSWKDISRSWLA